MPMSRTRTTVRWMMIAEGLLLAAFLLAYILDRLGFLELGRSGLELGALLLVSTAGWYLIVSLLTLTVRALGTGRREWQR